MGTLVADRRLRREFTGRPPQPEKARVFDFQAHFCDSAPIETHALSFRLRANAPDGQKRFPISQHLKKLPCDQSPPYDGEARSGVLAPWR